MLQCVQISVSFGGTPALDAVDLTVHDGEIVAVMGPSGCGKTTLLRVVAGLQGPDAGTIAWDGKALGDTPPHARGFGLMFQDYALFPHLDVKGNVEFGLRMRGMSAEDRIDRVDDMLQTVGLDGYADRKINELSGGEQQRVALARTLAPSPRLVLLDEPIGALDRTLREHLIAEMRDVFARLGVTALYVTHDRDEAFAIADTVAVMNHGLVVRKGTPEEIWRDPENEYVASLLGFDTIVAVEARAGWLDLGWARMAGDLPAGISRVAVPPHAVLVGDEGPIEGKVLSVTYHAGRYDIAISVGSLVIEAVSSHRHTVGDTVRFEIDGTQLLPIEDAHG